MTNAGEAGIEQAGAGYLRSQCIPFRFFLSCFFHFASFVCFLHHLDKLVNGCKSLAFNCRTVFVFGFNLRVGNVISTDCLVSQLVSDRE